jgi:hypothetical protein
VPIIPYADGITKTAKSPERRQAVHELAAQQEGQTFAIKSLGQHHVAQGAAAVPEGLGPEGRSRSGCRSSTSSRSCATSGSTSWNKDLRVPPVTAALAIERLEKRFVAGGKPGLSTT